MPKSAKKGSAAKKKGAVAFEMKHKDGTGVVGIGNLNVVLLKEDGVWFAQGLEIDYLVQGATMAEVKANFVKGLCDTLHQNVQKNGTIKPVLKLAPKEVWDELVFNLSAKLRGLSVVSICPNPETPAAECLPFRNIQFVEQEHHAA
jgi:hypothetical protein